MKTYARKCDITGEGMDEGFCIQDGGRMMLSKRSGYNYRIKN